MSAPDTAPVNAPVKDPCKAPTAKQATPVPAVANVNTPAAAITAVPTSILTAHSGIVPPVSALFTGSFRQYANILLLRRSLLSVVAKESLLMNLPISGS
jgi:hypothetical protein